MQPCTSGQRVMGSNGWPIKTLMQLQQLYILEQGGDQACGSLQMVKIFICMVEEE